jgi:hypothetical protein
MNGVNNDALTPAQCPRCGGDFGCGALRLDQPCPCSTVTLAPALQALLRQRWSSCLCLACLGALAGGAPLELPQRNAQ